MKPETGRMNWGRGFTRAGWFVMSASLLMIGLSIPAVLPALWAFFGALGILLSLSFLYVGSAAGLTADDTRPPLMSMFRGGGGGAC